MNAQSLMAHKDEIQDHMRRMKLAACALSETRLTPEIDDSEIHVMGYSVVRCDGENRNTGGVMMYIRNDIKYKILVNKKIIANCWCIAVEINDSMYKGVVIVIYHSPSAADGDFIRFLVDTVDHLVAKGQCMLLGDFNIDLLADTFYARKLISEMSSLGLKQYVDRPTRVTSNSQTLIDLVFANIKIKCKVYDKPKITDHSWLSVEVNVSKNKDKYKEVISREYSKFRINELLEAIRVGLDQNDCVKINERAEKFVDIMVAALDAVAPKKKFVVPTIWKGKKWFSDEIRLSTDRRDKAYVKAIYTRNEQDWIQFKIERNAVVKLIRKKKKEYYESMIDDNKSNPVRMWKALKEVLRGEYTGSRESDEIDFELLENIGDCSIANRFNEYYIQSINVIINSIGTSDSRSMECNDAIVSESVMDNFDLINVQKLEQIIMALPKKKGTDEGISSDILKTSFHVIKEELVRVINELLSNGICPEGWKVSTIIPIPKIEKPKKASDYRPINILPMYEK
ncbi:PREDICTED: uncharacterized protein LOC105456838, partial [Wasmannia auropunctata]|uniref:uncharacterized protein LOC105456838 n=1 Tax=Wasmannia auropunctata TaxID=64793 RepID=UPI0005EE89AC